MQRDQQTIGLEEVAEKTYVPYRSSQNKTVTTYLYTEADSAMSRVREDLCVPD